MKLVDKKLVGKLGRLGIPEQVREDLGMSSGTEVELYTDGTHLIVQPAGATKRCVLCGSSDDLDAFRGQYICGDCEEAIRDE